MAVMVKRYRVRHDDKIYKPGDVIVGLSKSEEAQLIAGSNGTIEKYVPPKGQDSVEGPTENVDGGSFDEVASLSSVDDLIKPARKK